MSWSTIVLMVFFSSRISPFTSTVIFFDRSPFATAVVTSAILRTWPVRLAAIRFTLSVRSFQVPATPLTLAWPPSLPSEPTSRATRVTSEAKLPSCPTMVLTTLPMRRNSPRSGRPSVSSSIALAEVPLRHGADHAGDLGGRLDEVADHRVDAVDAIAPAALGGRQLAALADLAFLADDLGDPVELPREALIEIGDVVEGLGDVAVDSGQIGRQAGGEIALSESPQRFQEQPGVKLRSGGLDLSHRVPVDNAECLVPAPLFRNCRGATLPGGSSRMSAQVKTSLGPGLVPHPHRNPRMLPNRKNREQVFRIRWFRRDLAPMGPYRRNTNRDRPVLSHHMRADLGDIP